MFTGIIEELGEVTAVETHADDSARLRLRGPTVTKDAAVGDSISVNGVCLTVAEVAGDEFCADLMKETLDRSSLGAVSAGDPVNLERAMAAGTRFGGHIVQGHVDGVATVLSREMSEHWQLVRISLPEPLAKYVVEKGSIAVDGISLTVAALGPGEFSVSLIPTTSDLTTLGRKAVGSTVNLEVDVIAKYVERLLGERS